MVIEQLMPHIEALIFASDRPLTTIDLIDTLKQALDAILEPERIVNCLQAIREKYASDYYPFQLCETGGGYQFLTKKDYHKTILHLHGDRHIKRLSNAAMETLAIIAYKQPVTKSEIEFIRGVSADYSIQKLLEKELIIISGRNEDMVGKPLTYITSRAFMDYLGINAPTELPQLKEFGGLETVTPTNGREATPEPANPIGLSINDRGVLEPAL
jgi:segregation and condensation protein B